MEVLIYLLERRLASWSLAMSCAGMLGKGTEARGVIDHMTERRGQEYSPALPIARTWLGLGEVNACLQWMEYALEEREAYLAHISAFPGYDVLPREARFVTILRSLGLKR
jgi:hypothetical protein